VKKLLFALIIVFVAAAAALSIPAPKASADGGPATFYIYGEKDFNDTLLYDAERNLTAGRTYVLRNDVYFYNYSPSFTVNFGGTLDGGGHALVGYRGNNPFFGSLALNSAITDLNIVGFETVSASLATFNGGTISGVRSYAKYSSAEIGALVVANSGTVENCLAVAIAPNYVSGGIVRIDNGVLTNDRYLIRRGADFTESSPAYSLGGEISDLADLEYYILSVSDESVAQTSNINLFNLSLDLSYIDQNINYDLNGFGFYNNKSNFAPDFEFDDPLPPVSEVIASEPSGTGLTEGDPYLISSIEELAYLAAIDTTGVYCLQTKDLSLYDFASAPDVLYLVQIPVFGGFYFGGGKSIFGITEPVFLENRGKIQNLYVKGRGALIAENYGNADRIKSDGLSIAETNEALASVSNSKSFDLASPVSYNFGALHRVYNASAVPFTLKNDGQINNCLNEYDIFFLDPASSGYVFASALRGSSGYEFRDDSGQYRHYGADIDYLSARSGAKWGAAPGFGMLYGEAEDIPVLVDFSEDVKYKAYPAPAADTFTDTRQYDVVQTTVTGVLVYIFAIPFDVFSWRYSSDEGINWTPWATDTEGDVVNAGIYRIYAKLNPALGDNLGKIAGRIYEATVTINKIPYVLDASNFNSPYSVVYDGPGFFGVQNLNPLNTDGKFSYVNLSYTVTGYREYKSQIYRDGPSNFQWSNSGTYYITVAPNPNNKPLNYNLSGAVPLTLTIVPRSIKLKPVLAAEYPYDTEKEALFTEYEVVEGSFPATDNIYTIKALLLEYTLTDYKDKDDPGGPAPAGTTCHIYVNDTPLIVNYRILQDTETFSVVKAAIPVGLVNQIHFSNAAYNYDGQYHTLTASSYDGTKLFASYSVSGQTATSFIDVPLNAAHYYTYTATFTMINPRTHLPDASNYFTYSPEPRDLYIYPLHLDIYAATPVHILYSEGVTYSYSDNRVVRADTGQKEALSGNPRPHSDYIPSDAARGNVGEYIINLDHIPSTMRNYAIDDFSYHTGTLIVSKISRATFLTYNQTAVYTGSTYVPNIRAPESFSPGYYYIVYREAGEAVDPVNVGTYTFDITIPSNQNYLETTVNGLQFSITPAELNLSAVYMRVDGLPAGASYVYKKYPYTVDFNIGGLPSGLEYSSEVGGTAYPGSSFGIAAAGVYSGIKLNIFGNPNYFGANKTFNNVTITPRPLIVDSIDLAAYTSKPLAPRVLIRAGDLIRGDPGDPDDPNDTTGVTVVSFTTGITPAPSELIVPGTYYLTLAATNTNYYIAGGATAFVIQKANAAIDANINETFGFAVTSNIPHNYFLYQRTFTLGSETLTRTVKFNISDVGTLYPGAGVYAVINIDNGYDSCVNYTMSGGSGYLKINPRPLTFDFNLQEHYDYTGGIIPIARSVAETEITGKGTLNNPVGARIETSATVRDVGTYTATIISGYVNFYFPENTFTFTVDKINLIIAPDHLTIAYGDPLPPLTALINGLAGEDTAESAGIVISSNYSQWGIPGVYSITAAADTQNYNVAIFGATLTVTNATLSGITFGDQTFCYDGFDKVPALVGLAGGEQVAFDRIPKGAGSYDVTATVTKTYYFALILSARVIIEKATPVVSLTPLTAIYRGGSPLLNSEIAGTAEGASGEPLEGAFEYVSAGDLEFGEHKVLVRFAPYNTNYRTVEIERTVTGYINEEDAQIVIEGYEGTDLTLGEEPIVIEVSAVSGISEEVELYVNGELIESGSYTVGTPQQNLLVEIKLNGEVIKSITLNVNPPVTPEDPENPGENPEEPEPPVTPGNPENPGKGGKARLDKKTLGIIGGVAGGVILIVIIIVIIVKKRGS
jgi:hypothetical protein